MGNRATECLATDLYICITFLKTFKIQNRSVFIRFCCGFSCVLSVDFCSFIMSDMDDDFMCDEDDDYDLVRLYGFACLVESELSGAECRI